MVYLKTCLQLGQKPLPSSLFAPDAPEQKGSLAPSPRGLLGQMRYGCKNYIWTDDWRKEAALRIDCAHCIWPDDSCIGMSLSGHVGFVMPSG